MRDFERRRRAIIVNTLTALAAVGAFVYALWALRPLILPFILGVLLAYLFRPLKTAFKYRWLPDSLRIMLLFSFLTGGLLGGIKFVKDNIPNEKEKLEILVRMKYKFNEKFDKMMGIDPKTGKGNGLYNLIAQDINPLRTSLNSYLELSLEEKEAFVNYYRGVEGFEPVPEKYYQYYLASIKESRSMAAVATRIATAKSKTDKTGDEQSFLKMLMGVVSIWFLLPIVFVFFLFDEGSIDQFFIRLVPNRYFELALTVQEEVDSAIGKYLRGISMECGLVGLTMATGLFVVGVSVKMSLLIGILAGLATAIPFLGPVVGLSFGLTYALIVEEIHPFLPFVNLDNFPLVVLVVNAIVMILDNLVYQPVVLGGAVNLHPLVVILGIMAASMLFGMPGVLLAIPTIVVMKVIIQHTFRGLKDYRII